MADTIFGEGQMFFFVVGVLLREVLGLLFVAGAVLCDVLVTFRRRNSIW